MLNSGFLGLKQLISYIHPPYFRWFVRTKPRKIGGVVYCKGCLCASFTFIPRWCGCPFNSVFLFVYICTFVKLSTAISWCILLALSAFWVCLTWKKLWDYSANIFVHCYGWWFYSSCLVANFVGLIILAFACFWLCAVSALKAKTAQQSEASKDVNNKPHKIGN